MTHQELTILLKYPQTVKTDEIPQLKELLDSYPYFTPARMLHLRALQQSDDICFEKALNQAALFAHDRRWLYYFVYPEKKADKKQKYVRAGNTAGDYFGMLEAVEREGKDVNQSLKVLAERLKAARLDVLSGLNPEQNAGKEPNAATVSEKTEGKQRLKTLSPSNLSDENYAEKVKILMCEKKYAEALEILKELNLNNPKKSIYFADQIRFLEKIIDNKKK